MSDFIQSKLIGVLVASVGCLFFPLKWIDRPSSLKKRQSYEEKLLNDPKFQKNICGLQAVYGFALTLIFYVHDLSNYLAATFGSIVLGYAIYVLAHTIFIPLYYALARIQMKRNFRSLAALK